MCLSLKYSSKDSFISLVASGVNSFGPFQATCTSVERVLAWRDWRGRTFVPWWLITLPIVSAVASRGLLVKEHKAFPQFTPSHSLRFLQFIPSIHSHNPFPHKSHSLTSHVPSIPLTSPQIPPIHSLNSLLHIPSIHSLTSLNSFHQFFPSHSAFPQFTPSHSLRFLQFIPSIHSHNPFPHKSHSLTSHVPSIPLTSPQIPPIHSLNSLLKFISSIYSFTFPQFTPSQPSIRSINSFPRFPSIESFSPLNCSIESFIKYISPQFTPPYPHLVPNTPRFTVSQSNFSSFLLESW